MNWTAGPRVLPAATLPLSSEATALNDSAADGLEPPEFEAEDRLFLSVRGLPLSERLTAMR